MSSELKVDTISEKTTASGVTIDSVLIKDGEVDGVDVSAITQGITEADQWRLTTTITNTTADITSGWERSDDALASYLGTGMSESSGIFTFPSTGIYLITIFSCGETTNQSTNLFNLQGTTDNFSSEDTLCRTDNDNANGSLVNYVSSVQVIVDITDTTNRKVKFSTQQSGSGAKILGNSNMNRTGATFIRLGDT